MIFNYIRKMEYSLEPVDINVIKRNKYLIIILQKYGIHTYNYLLIQAKRDNLNIKKLNPPGIFKKKKGQRNLGEKYNSKFYPDNYKKDVLYMNYDDLLDNLYMENKGIDFGLRSYKNYNKKNNNIMRKNIDSKKQYDDKNKDDKIEFRINKGNDNDLMKKYVNNQFTFKQNDNNLELNNNMDINLESNNSNNNQENDLENNNTEKIIINKNNENYEQEPIINEDNNNITENIGYEDIRLNYVMTKLGLEDLLPIFEQYHMSFNDILFLTKDDLNELGLKIFQKNRLISFVEEYSAKAKNYTLEEIETFFEENKIYNITNNED